MHFRPIDLTCSLPSAFVVSSAHKLCRKCTKIDLSHEKPIFGMESQFLSLYVIFERSAAVLKNTRPFRNTHIDEFYQTYDHFMHVKECTGPTVTVRLRRRPFELCDSCDQKSWLSWSVHWLFGSMEHCGSLREDPDPRERKQRSEMQKWQRQWQKSIGYL